MLAGCFAPEQSADTHLNVDMAEDFARYGAEVTVVVPFPARGVTPQIQKAYLDKRDEVINDRLHILRVGKPDTFHRNLLLRGLALLKNSWLLYRTGKKLDADAYFILSSPPFLGYVGALLARRAPVFYKLQDLFPDSLLHAKGLREAHPAIRLLRGLERLVYRRVTQIHVVSEDMKTTLLARGVPEEKMRVVLNWIDEHACVPVARKENPLFEQFGLSREGFYVCYAGNIGLLQNVETILKAAVVLEQKAPEITFVIIGDGAWKPEMDAFLRDHLLSNVKVFPMQPVQAVSQVYSLGDVDLVSLKPGVTKMAMPSKTWSILSAARPVICEIDLDSGLRAMAEEGAWGVCVASGDAEALADAILAFYKMPQAEREAMGQRGRDYIEAHLTRGVSTKLHIALVQELLKNRG